MGLKMTQEYLKIEERLANAGLRSTRQRVEIGNWLFSGGDKHFTAEDIHNDFLSSGTSVSLATIYNTLGVFTEAGLLHTVSVEGDRVYYDTNTSPHHHFYDEAGRQLTDFDIGDLELSQLPALPDGQTIDRIDVIIRTKTV